ncbi:hypothetical protein [Neorhizobium sp. DAR64860/K0K1]|uniref:hypothetical protein n=1 Tax=Neorhizobium sp. DAR64860/K0K1 TaxID=3421955 RepID=UPI003D282339
MNRRTILKGAIVASATPAAAWAPPHADVLDALLREYEAATRLDYESWEIVCDLEDVAHDRGARDPRVQICSTWDGKTEDGKNITKPVYAYSVAEIRDWYEKNNDTQLLFVSNDEGRARVRAETDKRMTEKVARFEALQSECRRIEDACGYSAAMERAKACSEAVRSIEGAILALVPTTLDEAAKKARWIIAELDSGRGYLNDREWADLMLDAMAPLGRAAA